MNKQFIQYILSFCALVVIGVALRVVGLSFQPLWWDEGFSLYFATEAPARLLELTSLDIHPPLYYLLLQAWMAVVGIGALSARGLSVLVGVLALPVAWAVARRFLGWREAWISVWLLALSPLHIFYSQEVRMYGLVTLWALLAVWAWQQRRWVLLGLMVLAGMLTHYYFLFMALALALLIVGDARKGGYEALRGPLQALLVAVVGYLPWLIYAALRLIRYLEGKLEVEADTPMTPLEFLPRHLEAWSVGHLEPGWTWLAWGTWLFVALVLLGLSQREKKRAPSPGPHPPAPSPNTPHASGRGRGGERSGPHRESSPNTPHASGRGRGGEERDRGPRLIHLFSPLSPREPFDRLRNRGVGGVRAEAEGHVTLLVLWLVPTGCVFLVGLVAPFVALRIERQLLFVLPFFLMLVARGVVVLWRRWSWGVLPVLLLITAINMGSLWGFYTVPRYPGEDYRPILADVGALQGPGDGWLAIYEWQIGYLRAYLPDAHPTPLLVPGTTPGADDSTSWVDGSERKEAIEAGVAGLLSEHRRIWFPAYQVKGRFLEEEVGQAFRETGASAWDEWYANTRLYLFGSAPPSWGALSANSSQELGLEVAGEFEGVGEVRATLGNLPATWSGIGIIPLLIEVDKVPQGVRASVQLLSNNPQRGGVWGEWDGPIGADSETPPVTDLVDVLPQEGTQDERLQLRAGLPVAHGTPPGEYVVQLTLYASPPELEGQRTEGQGAEGGRVGEGESGRGGEWERGRVGEGESGRGGEGQETEGQGAEGQGAEGQAAEGQGAEAQGAEAQETEGQEAEGQGQVGQPLNRVKDGVPTTPEAIIGTVSVVRAPISLPPDALRRLANKSLDLSLGDKVQLLGASVPEANTKVWQQGDKIPITLFWQSHDAMANDLHVFLQAIDATGTPHAIRDLPPINGTFPTTQWQAGDLVRDPHQLYLPADMPAGHYQLIAGLYDPATGERLPILQNGGAASEGASKRSEDAFPLGAIEVQERERILAEPNVGIATDIPFGERARLAQQQIAPQLEAGVPLNVTLLWQARATGGSTLHAFVQLYHNNEAQIDSSDHSLDPPASAWISGEWIVDQHTVALPAELAPGNYKLVVGLYEPQSGVRLPTPEGTWATVAEWTVAGE